MPSSHHWPSQSTPPSQSFIDFLEADEDDDEDDDDFTTHFQYRSQQHPSQHSRPHISDSLFSESDQPYIDPFSESPAPFHFPSQPNSSTTSAANPVSNHLLPNTLFRASSSGFLSSDSSDDDDDDDDDGNNSATVFSTNSRPFRPPKSIKGTKTSFILGARLGEGAYAVVKEGIDEQSLRMVAVKVLDLRRIRRIRGGFEAIEREVSVQKRLKRHENLIELIDVIRQQSPKMKMYIVLEMATGCSVQELVDSSPGKRLCESQVANFMHQTLTGLQYMHGKGVVHRDIKPSNMMLSVNGVLKISDFGVAEFLDEYNSEDNVSRTSGSPAFQAPEIANGDHGYSGMKTDVWALGVSLYMLLTGRVPFEGSSLVSLFESISCGVYEPIEDISSEAQDVISRMLTVSWKDRASVDELLKHPWVARGAVKLSFDEKGKRGWIRIPKKEFGILEVLKQMFHEETASNGIDILPGGPSSPDKSSRESLPTRAGSSTGCCVV